MKIPTLQLNNGIRIPLLGLGTYKAHGDDLTSAVHTAIECGYRHIDTASFYNNEDDIGNTLRSIGTKRKELFITSKVWNTEQGYHQALKAFDRSINKLQTDYLDLYLIHWPQPNSVETWKAMSELYEKGKVRCIGVSNFMIRHLELLITQSGTLPAVNQVELHPRLQQKELREFCKKHSIAVEAWSPLMRGRAFAIPVIYELSQKYSKTPAQIILRWETQQNIIAIPKSTTLSRIKENMDIFDFTLTGKELQQLSDTDTGERTGPNPDSITM